MITILPVKHLISWFHETSWDLRQGPISASKLQIEALGYLHNHWPGNTDNIG